MGGASIMNRRRFLHTAVSSAAILAGAPRVFGAAAKYDLLIKDGRVIDPSLRLDAVGDVAISDGRIAAVDPSIMADAAENLDARRKLSKQGLHEIHTLFA